MNPVREALKEYLAMRRALGYKLEREGRCLPQFLDYMLQRGEQHLSTRTAVAWATLPSSGPGWWSARLRMVRAFAVYLHHLDPEHQVPASDLLPCKPARATPYLYDQAQIDALISAATTLRTPHRVATIQTLIGLLAVTGMRIGEAVALDREDFNPATGCIVVRDREPSSLRPNIRERNRILVSRPKHVVATHRLGKPKCDEIEGVASWIRIPRRETTQIAVLNTTNLAARGAEPNKD